MKIIDLLNKIANGERIPKKIKYKEEILEYDGCDNYYIDEDLDRLFYEYDWINSLNDEIEIIEEDKKIKKIPMVNEFESNIVSHNQVRIKINEIIDYINRGE